MKKDKEFWKAFTIDPKNLDKFLEKTQESDSMGGNFIESVLFHDSAYVVLISRRYSYPFVMTELDNICRHCRGSIS